MPQRLIFALLASMMAIGCGNETTQPPQDEVPDGVPPPTLVAAWGDSGSEDGRFQRPEGIVVDGQNVIHVVDRGNYRIQQFTSTGEFLFEFGSFGNVDMGDFGLPRFIAVDAESRLHVTDDDHASIRAIDVFTSNGEYLFSNRLGSNVGESITGITIGASGSIYFAHTNKIRKSTADYEPVTSWGGGGSAPGELNQPMGLASDSDENIYVADRLNNRIQVFDSQGEFLRQWGGAGSEDGRLDSPHDVAVDSFGQVHVVDSGNRRIQVFDSYGAFLMKYGVATAEFEGLEQPMGIAIDSEDHVYVVDSGAERILKFGPVVPLSEP